MRAFRVAREGQGMVGSVELGHFDGERVRH